MKHLLLILAILLALTKVYSQSIRVAILDFENISGIAKYDGLGKAMSSMLISDIEANVSAKRLQLVERAQIQKVLKEQKFQTSGNVNKNTAVQAGKILGVNYLLVGDIYILKDQLIINARLTNTETGDIVFSKKQEGKLISWLNLKTNIAKNLAQSLSQPFTIPTIPDKEVTTATITTFGNAIAAKDSGNIKVAETLSTTILEFNPDFKYIDELKKEIDQIKRDLIELNEKVDDALDNPEELSVDLINRNLEINKALSYLNLFESRNDYYSQFGQTKKIFINYQKARAFYRLGDLNKNLAYYDSCLIIDKNFLLAHYNKMMSMMGGEFMNISEDVKILDSPKDFTNDILNHFNFFTSYNKSNIKSFNKSIYRSTDFNDKGKCDNNLLSNECDFFSYMIELPKKNGSTVFDDLFRDIQISKLYDHITYPTNDICRYLLSKNNLSLSIQILENSINQQFDFVDSLGKSSESSGYYNVNRNFQLFKKTDRKFIGDNRLKYFDLINKHSYYLIDENSTFEKSLFDNILLLSQLYIKNNQSEIGIELIDNFRLITEKLFFVSKKNIFQMAYFEFYINQLLLSEFTQKISESNFDKISKIYNSLKEKSPNYFQNKELDFKSFYSYFKNIESKKYSNENFLALKQITEKKRNIVEFFNHNCKTVEEVKNYYNYNNQNKIMMVHCYIDSVYDSEDYNKEFYLTFNCVDAIGNNYITINANRNIFEKECKYIDSLRNTDDFKITLLISLDENGEIYLLDIEFNYLNYNSLTFSGKSMYDLSELGELKPSQMTINLENCLNKLSTTDVKQYYQGLNLCFKQIGYNKSFRLIVNNSFLLNNLAWSISNSLNPSKEDLEIAVDMAKRASFIVFDTDHNILDTYALSLLKVGNKEKSKEILNKAIQIAKNNNEPEAVQKYLNKLKTY